MYIERTLREDNRTSTANEIDSSRVTRRVVRPGNRVLLLHTLNYKLRVCFTHKK